MDKADQLSMIKGLWLNMAGHLTHCDCHLSKSMCNTHLMLVPLLGKHAVISGAVVNVHERCNRISELM